MHKYVVAAVLALAAFSLALEYPVVPGVSHAGGGVARTDRVPTLSPNPGEPIWTGLAAMPEAERANSRINVELSSGAPDEASSIARQIEELWNGGRYDEALAHFTGLARLVNPAEVAIGNAWRTPVPTVETDWWGRDIRIGSHDSVRVVALDVHPSTGKLFAILLYDAGVQDQWSVNFSTDSGATWNETYNWSAAYDLWTLNASVLVRDCYVAYGSGVTEARIRRFDVGTGSSHQFHNGADYITVLTTTVPDTVKEAAIASNQDDLHNRLYFFAITAAGSLKYFWSDTGAVNWTEVSTGITDANRGLDASTNKGFDSLFCWVSYITNSNDLNIDAASNSAYRTYSQWSGLGSSADYSSISAYNDTIICAFDGMWLSTSVCLYLTSYDGGLSWYYGCVGGDTLTTAESPAVAARAGGGQGIAWRYYAPTRELRYTWRNYSGAWTPPVAFADREPWWNQPAIQYIGGGIYGVVHTSWSGPYLGAYFDRSDWTTGVVERPVPGSLGHAMSVAPNPVNRSAEVRLAVSRAGNVAVRLFDRTGRLLATLCAGARAPGSYTLGLDGRALAPGIYFLRAETPDGRSTIPLAVVK